MLVGQGQVYQEEIIVSVGKMQQVHALVEFTPSFQYEVQHRWRHIQMTARTAKLGVIAVGVLLALSVVLGYFKADTATRGYYSTRLQFASATAIMALAVGGYMLFRYL
jgi:hypothetical protein